MLTEQQLLAVDLSAPTSDENRLQRIDIVRSLADVPVDSPLAHLLVRFLHEDEFQLNLQSLIILKKRLDIAKKFFAELLAILSGLLGGWKRTSLCEILADTKVQQSEFLNTLNELGNKDESTAKAIWNITGNIDAIMPILDNLLRTPREETCDLIYEIGPQASFTAPTLATALASDDADLRWAVVCALGALGEGAKIAIPQLIKSLNDGSGLVAGCAAHALAKIGRSSLPALIGALHSESSRTREFAADALGTMGEAALEAVPHLNALLTDSIQDVVDWASIAVGEITGSSHVLPLLALVEKTCAHESVRQRARQAINTIKQKA